MSWFKGYASRSYVTRRLELVKVLNSKTVLTRASDREKLPLWAVADEGC